MLIRTASSVEKIDSSSCRTVYCVLDLRCVSYLHSCYEPFEAYFMISHDSRYDLELLKG